MTDTAAPLQERIMLGLLQLMGRLPFGLVRALGRAVGTVSSLLPLRARQTTDTNLRLCFPDLPEAERRRLVRASLQETATTALEMGPMWFWPAERTLGLLRHIHHEDLYREALTDPRGLVLLAPHLGNWELAGLYASRTTRLTGLYQPPRQLLLERAILAARQRNGGTYVPTNRRGVMALFRALQSGETVGILPDQEPEPESGVFAPFFGIPALTVVLPCHLLARTHARVLLIVAWRNHAEGGFDIAFEEAGEGLHDPDPAKAVAAMNAAIERVVRQHPEQYQWEYKRFKQRPNGEERFY